MHRGKPEKLPDKYSDAMHSAHRKKWLYSSRYCAKTRGQILFNYISFHSPCNSLESDVNISPMYNGIHEKLPDKCSDAMHAAIGNCGCIRQGIAPKLEDRFSSIIYYSTHREIA